MLDHFCYCVCKVTNHFFFNVQSAINPISIFFISFQILYFLPSDFQLGLNSISLLIMLLLSSIFSAMWNVFTIVSVSTNSVIRDISESVFID